MSKADHMLSILWLLRSGRRMTAKQLAEQLEIHVRTVYRCIDALCASGVPVVAESGPNGGYRLIDGFRDAPLLFDADEQKALVHASTFAAEAGYPFADELARAIGKLKRFTNEAQLERIERHGDGLAVIHPPVEPGVREQLQLLEEAAAEGRSVRMHYHGRGSDDAVVRELDPYGIVHWKGQWYVVGYCRLRLELRSFRVDRIARLEPAGGRFERPAGFSAKQFLIDSLFPGSVRAEETVEVRIRGPARALNELCRHWLFGHALVARDGGEAAFRLGRESLTTYVPYFLLPYGRALTIVEPRELIGRMAEVAADVAEHYAAMRSKAAANANGDARGATAADETKEEQR